MTRLVLLRIANLPFESLAPLADPEMAAAAASLTALDAELGRDAGTLGERLFDSAGPASDDPERAARRFAVLRVRRDVHNGRRPRERDLGAARTLLADATIFDLKRHVGRLEARERTAASYAARYAEAVSRCRRELLRLAATPLVEHGIYLASRSLLPKTRRLASTDPQEWSHDQRHAAAKVAAYVARFATKTSPNGVFCSVALAHAGGPAALVTGVAAIDRVDVLLSLSESRKIAAVLAVDPAVERAVVPRVNPTLVEDGDRTTLTFWKPASPRNPTDREVFARVKAQPLLQAFLHEAASGAANPQALIEAVAARVGHDPAELRPVYALLVEKGILIGEIEIPYSSRRRLRDLASAARRAGGDAPWIPAVERVERAVDDVAALPLERRNDALDRIAEEAGRLPRARPFNPDELFRVDSASALDVRLPGHVLDELSRGVRLLVRLLTGMFPESAAERRFVGRFLGSHPPDADVPFLTLYRGFAESPDAEDAPAREFPRPADAPPDEEAREAWTCARRVWEWFTSRAGSPDAVEIDDATARSLAGDFPEPRWAAGALFQIAARSAGDLSAGRYMIVLNGLFNGIGLALSRFAHLLGNEVVDELRRASSSMGRPGAVLAEITFNHEARTANAGLRPILFGHEIELPGDLGSPGVERITIDDLTIRYDTSQGRLVLRSVSRGVEVIPVLTSGVSPSGIVSDLIHIGRQGWQTVGYLPGFAAPGISRWPRFVCGRTVLFRARWIFEDERMPPVTRGKLPLDDSAFFLELTRWRLAHRLPRHVFAHTRSETKPFHVDLESPVLVELLRRALVAEARGPSPAFYVTEMLPQPEELWIRDGHRSYASEFLVQLGTPDAGASS